MFYRQLTFGATFLSISEQIFHAAQAFADREQRGNRGKLHCNIFGNAPVSYSSLCHDNVNAERRVYIFQKINLININ